MIRSVLSEFLASLRIGLGRRPGLVALNFSVLVVGMVIVLVIAHEEMRRKSYDRWLPDHERLYRIEGVTHGIFAGPEQSHEALPGPAGALIERGLPAIVGEVSRFYVRRESLKAGRDAFDVMTGFADPVFLSMFGFSFLHGDPDSALDSPSNIVLTERSARRLFGDTNVVGQLVEIVEGGNARPMWVSAVLADLPVETHFDFEALVPFEGNLAAGSDPHPERWLSFNILIYLKTAAKLPEGDLDRFLKASVKPMLPTVSAGETVYDMREHLDFRAVSIVGLDLRSPARAASGQSYAQRLAVLRVFAGLIFLIIGVTYANNATALGLARSREMAVRKAVGATPSRIFLAFLVETATLVLLATSAAALLAPDAARILYRLVEFGSGAFRWQFVSPWTMLLLLVVLTLAFGFYPAFRLSRILPAEEFNTGFGHGPSLWVRRVRAGLVLLQFIGAAAAIAVTLTYYRQWHHLSQEDPGFDAGGLYAIWNAHEAYGAWPALNSRPAFLNALRRIDGVVSVSQSEIAPPSVPRNSWTFMRPGGDERVRLLMNPVDPNFDDVYRLPLRAGRFFAPGRMTDEVADYFASRNVVINDLARRAFGFATPEEAVGETLLIPLDQGAVPVTVVGVMADAAFEGLKKGFEPRIFFHVGPAGGGKVTLRYAGDDPAALRAAVEDVWRQFVGFAPVAFGAVDTALADAAREERTQATAVGLFAGLALFFSTLGLYGLAALLMTERRREIALRKLFGAGALSIAARLFGRFLWPVLLGNLIAVPLAGLYLVNWLEAFPSRIALTAAPFLLAAGTTLIASALVVMVHVRRGMRLGPTAALSVP